ncbi:hypothetical protein, partial [Oscillibacter sp.]|uniref:hypothetical protein n=1 Tax=Oscillibacter sp. TaxID=1945593 RepID=UPI00289A8397
TIELELGKETAGAIAQELSSAGYSADKMDKATKKANKSMGRFAMRVREVVRSALVFTLITQALSKFREWSGKVIKTNAEASASISRLKGALLTLAQPLVDVIIPAITKAADILTAITTTAARLAATLSGTTLDKSREAAEALHDETEALDDTGKAADKATKSMASFDEINQLSGDNTESISKSDVDFSGPESDSWLTEMMGKVSAWVPTALLLGGIALVAIGAASGSLALVTAGLMLLISGFTVAGENAQLQSWVTTLGLSNVEEFVVVALLLGGIAMVAIGAATGNVLLVVAGLLLIGATVYYSEKGGMMNDWAETLGLSRAAQWVTAALLIGGMALLVFGIVTGNVLMVVSGIALLGAGVYVGTKSGVLQSWSDALGLGNASNWVTAALLISGMALLIFGILLKNIAMIVAGIGLIGVGVAVGASTGTFKSWWDALNLPQAQDWITKALIIGGIALVVFGILMHNILMIVGGFVMLNIGVSYGQASVTFDNWWDALGLPNAEKWITAILLIAGVGLLVISILTANVPAFFAALVLLGVGMNLGEKSGTFESWAEALHLDDVAGKVTAGIMLAGIALIAIGAATLNPFLILAGLGILGVGAVANALTAKKSASTASAISGAGNASISSSGIQGISSYNVPHLATGAVIPPNREFMAVLGDQKSGNNIEAPEALLQQMANNAASANAAMLQKILDAILAGKVMTVDGQQFGRVVYGANKSESQRVGISLVNK